MKNKKANLNKFWLIAILGGTMGAVTAQDLHIGNGASFHLKSGLNFSLGNTPITQHTNGLFGQVSGLNWGSPTIFVDGKITVYGAGTTIVNIGDSARSTVTITTAATDELVCDYTRLAATGLISSLLPNYKLSDNEYWTIEKNNGSSPDVNVTGLTPMAGATYDGNLPAGTVTLVRYNDNTSEWEAYSGSTGFGKFAFASDQSLLGISDIVSEASFSIYPNPVVTETATLQYILPSSVNQLDISIVDITGKIIKQYYDLPVQHGVNSITKPEVAEGMYFIKFSFNNGTQQLTKKIIFE